MSWEYPYPEIAFADNISENIIKDIIASLQNETECSIENWGILTKIFKSHWIFPLVYFKLKNSGKIKNLPSEAIEQLKKTFLRSKINILIAEQQLKEILYSFKNSGIDALVLKGVHLAFTHYPHPATRLFSDIDLLLRPEDIPKARRIMEKLGYVGVDKRYSLCRDFSKDEIFLHKTKKYFKVEFHWHLHCFSFVKESIDIDDLFESAIDVETGLIEFKAFSSIDALIHRALSIYLSDNQSLRIIWLYDLFLLTKALKTSEDWNRLWNRCIQQKTLIPVISSLHILSKFFSLEPLEMYENIFSYPKPSKEEFLFYKNLPNNYENLLRFVKLHFSKSTPWHKRLIYFFHLLFPHPNYIKHAYPPADGFRLPFAYLRRIKNRVLSPSGKVKNV